MFDSRKMIAAVVIAVTLIAAFLGFTKTGHNLLYQIGFTTACDSGCS